MDRAPVMGDPRWSRSAAIVRRAKRARHPPEGTIHGPSGLPNGTERHTIDGGASLPAGRLSGVRPVARPQLRSEFDGRGADRPWATVKAAACGRLDRWSFSSVLWTWFLTVPSVIVSWLAISLF